MAALLFFSSCHPDRLLLACVKYGFKSEFGRIRHFGRFLCIRMQMESFYVLPFQSLWELYKFFSYMKDKHDRIITFRLWYCCLGCKLITEAISMYMNGKRYSNVPKLFSISRTYDICNFQSISCSTFCFHSKMLYCAICEIFVREIFPSVLIGTKAVERGAKGYMETINNI